MTPLAIKHLHLAILHLLGLFYHSVVAAANNCFIVAYSNFIVCCAYFLCQSAQLPMTIKIYNSRLTSKLLNILEYNIGLLIVLCRVSHNSYPLAILFVTKVFV